MGSFEGEFRGDVHNVEELRSPVMEPPYPGFVLDPTSCCKLSIEEKRKLFHELSQCPERAPEKLQTWGRMDFLDILSAVTGKERKRTSLTKQKLLEQIFRAVAERKHVEHTEDVYTQTETHTQSSSKRKRKSDQPSRLPLAIVDPSANIATEERIFYCLNLSCRATIGQEDVFCKRCSCHICLKYDDNKDPSLWLVCSSEDPSEGDPCGLSCHLECALKNASAGISKTEQCGILDGSYYCIHCGKVNDLLRCWRKQLVIAKDARRVDILCYRVSLSHKLLSLTEKYQGLHKIVDIAMKKLESEVGTLDGMPNMARGIVNRLSVGADVQSLCALAVEAMDSMHFSIHQIDSMATSFVKFEDVSPTSVTVVLRSEDYASLHPDLVGFTLCYRNADTADYPAELTHKLLKATRRFLVSDLTPGTEYMFRVIPFDNARELAKWEVGVNTETISSTRLQCGNQKTNSSCLSNLSSEESNTNAFLEVITGSEKSSQRTYKDDSGGSQNACTGGSQNACTDTAIAVQVTGYEETPGTSHCAMDEEPNDSNTPVGDEMTIVPYVMNGKESSDRYDKPDGYLLENGPMPPERVEGSELNLKDGSPESAYEYCIKVVRQLECDRHIETSFRVKFLTWFSLRATPQEKRVVKVFVDTLVDDPTGLAEQLVHSFSDAVSRKRPLPVPTGFCFQLQH